MGREGRPGGRAPCSLKFFPQHCQAASSTNLWSVHRQVHCEPHGFRTFVDWTLTGPEVVSELLKDLKVEGMWKSLLKSKDQSLVYVVIGMFNFQSF